MPRTVKRTKMKGYTLIELMVVIAVVGIMIGSAAAAYNLYRKNDILATTVDNTSAIMAAMTDFLIQNGRYPCPARLDAARTDADYGMETDCTNVTVLPGQCSGGICIEESERTVTVNSVVVTPRVRRGAIPFRILNRPEFLSEDGNRNRIEYAVTEFLTSVDTYDRDRGGISVIDGQATPRSLVNPASSAHFIVLSHGDDEAGAYTKEGKLTIPCGAGLDAENCNTDATNLKAIYRVAPLATAASADHFDDHVKFYTSENLPLWVIADTDAYHLRDSRGASSIGVGKTPAAGYLVDVEGNARAAEIHMDTLCDASTGRACFETDKIAGARPEMLCPVGQFVTGFNGVGALGVHAVCEPVAEIRCPKGKVVTGINADGSLSCAYPPMSCPAQPVNLCTLAGTVDTENLPVGVEGQTFTTPVSGDSYTSTYLCHQGKWAYQISSGFCACTPASESKTYACSSWYLGPAAGWSGTTVTVTRDLTCPAAVVNLTLSGNTCSCVAGATQKTVEACPAGYSGAGIETEKTWVCDGALAGHWGAPAEIANDCTCTADQSKTETLTCSEGYSGSITRHSDFTCATGVWSPWVTDANTCACTPGAVRTRKQECPAGQAGEITQTSTLSCAPDAWSAWVTTGNTCAAETKKWSVITPALGPYIYKGSVYASGDLCTVNGREASCYSPAGNNTYYQYQTCRCQ